MAGSDLGETPPGRLRGVVQTATVQSAVAGEVDIRPSEGVKRPGRAISSGKISLKERDIDTQYRKKACWTSVRHARKNMVK